MNKQHLIIEAILLVLVLGLAGVVWSQTGRVDELDAQTEKLEARLEYLESRPGSRVSQRAPHRLKQPSDVVDREQDEVLAYPDEAPGEERRMWRERAAEALDEESALDIDDP